MAVYEYIKKCFQHFYPLAPNLGGKKVHFFEISKIAHALRAISYIIKKQFNLPDYCGNNLDALWDFLDGDDCPHDSKIEIYGIEYLNTKFDGYGEKIKQLFEDCQMNMEMKI